MTASFQLPPEAARAFALDGAVVLRGLLNAAELTQLTAGIEHNLANLSPLALVASQADDPGRFVEDFALGRLTRLMPRCYGIPRCRAWLGN